MKLRTILPYVNALLPEYTVYVAHPPLKVFNNKKGLIKLTYSHESCF